MIVKTKKCQLDTNVYRKIGLKNIIKDQIWLPIAIFVGLLALNGIINIWYRNWWMFIFAFVGAGLWYAFWWIQFTGVPKLPQNQIMFEKLYYEFSSPQILIKRNEKEGMQIKWEMIKSVEKTADAFILYMGRAQFFHFPFKIFPTEHDLKMFETIMKRKKYTF